MTQLNRSFAFDLELEGAYKDSKGELHVFGIASDDEVDRAGDRMSEKAIRAMAAQCKANALPLLDNHRATFGFGHTHDAEVIRSGKSTKLKVDFKLDPKYPQALDLYQEVESGKSRKQLSIGGHIDLKSSTAVSLEEIKEASGKKRYVRRIDEIDLEHIAATRPGQACVSRTKFIDAVVKDVFGDDDALPESLKTQALALAEKAVSGAPDALANLPADVEIVVRRRGFPPPATDDEDEDEDTECGKTKPAPTTSTVPAGTQEPTVSKTATSETTQAALAAATAEKGAATPAPAGTPPAPAADKASLDKDAQNGLNVLKRLGTMFNSDTDAGPQVEVIELAKAADKVLLLRLTEKSLPDVRRVQAALNKLLATEGQEEKTPAEKSLSRDDIKAIVEKAIQDMVPGLLVKLEPTPVVASFEKSFGGLTEELAKGLVEMGGGFKAAVEKAVGGLQAEIKAGNERIAKLEKASGVRQSAPTQDVGVVTGAPQGEPVTKSAEGQAPPKPASRRPDEKNPFRGAFDAARQKYMAQHRE